MLRRLLLPLATLLSLLPRASVAGDPPEAQRFALAVFHYNVQYVAGGLEGFVADYGLEAAWAGLDYTETGVEDAIIRESLLPVLELYAAHPGWGADIEMQGYMVDSIRQRHPDVLELMRQLDGQLSFDSFHYGDELWTAQPAGAIARSRARTGVAFQDGGLALGDATFTQEGQFSMGMDAVLPPGHTIVLPRNLFGLHYPEEARRPLFAMGEDFVVVGGHSFTQQVEDSAIEVQWTFLDDGELLATGDIPPYLLPSFVHDPAEVAAYEAGLLALEDQGWQMATVAQAKAALLAAGYEPEPLPPIADGTWQPDDTGNLSRWMGDFGLDPDTEADGAVRAAWHLAWAQVRLASLLADEEPAEAWRELMLAGVSDSTGWNPLRTETDYAFLHATSAIDAATPILEGVLEPCKGCVARIDGTTGEVEEIDPETITLEEVEAALPGVVATAEDGGIGVEVHWFELSTRPGATGLAVEFSGLLQADPADRSVEIPLATDVLRWIPAGRTEGWAELPLEVFAGSEDPVGVPLANGLLDLGDGLFLVLAPGSTMLAARVHPDSGFVTFRDRTAGREDRETWEMYFVDGQQAAEDLAYRLVQAPDLWFEPPAAEGCQGCSSSAGGAGPGYVIVLVLPWLRMRRR